jgi:DNA polymerase elongation subunit (family B)
LKAYATNLREGRFNARDLVISKRLSKNPNEYTNLVPQAIAARHLVKEGGTVHAGQSVSYVLVKSSSRILENRALPAEFLSGETQYDAEKYVDLLLSSAVNLLLPFGCDLKSLRTKVR